MLEVTVPRKIRIADMLSGPADGWYWHGTRSAIRVSCADPPVDFVEPLGVAMLGAWATYQRANGIEIIVDDSLKSPIAFGSGLLSALNGRSHGGTASSRFFRLTSEREVQYNLSSFVEAAMPVATDATEIAQYCLSDLAQNVFDHACTHGQGAFCAISLDRQKSRVRLAVADCGQGIPADIKHHYEGSLDDRESLMLALEPEFSGFSARSDVNRGVGLYFVRRLALAADGAFCAITEGLSARSSARDPSSFAPAISAIGERWQGTALAVTFIAEGANYAGPMQAIIDEIEGRGPRYADIQFFKQSEPSADWIRVPVGCDRGKFAIDRERAIAIANEVSSNLASGASVELDFTGVAKATQPFCHALIVPLMKAGGPGILARLRFIGCSAPTRSPIRFAVTYATSQDTP